MHQLKNLIKIEFRTFFKVMIAAFFGILFPIIMMIVIMLSTGNPEINEEFNLINKYLAIALALGVAPTALLSLSISIASDYEFEVVERMELFKISRAKLLAAKFIVNFAFVLIQMIIAIIIALIFFELKMISPINFLIFISFYTMATITLFLMAYIIARLNKKIAKTQMIGMFVMFLFIGLAEGFGSLGDLLDGNIRYATFFIPLVDITQKFSESWLGGSFNYLFYFLKYSIYIIVLLLISYLITRKNKKN